MQQHAEGSMQVAPGTALHLFLPAAHGGQALLCETVRPSDPSLPVPERAVRQVAFKSFCAARMAV